MNGSLLARRRAGSRRSRRVGWTAGLAIVTTLALGACASSGSSSNSGDSSSGEYVLGAMFSLTNPAGAANAIPISHGLQAAIDGINRRGGVNGHKIDLKTLDDGGNAGREASVFRQLLGDNVSAIAGLDESSDLAVVVPLADQYKVPVMSIGAPETDLVPGNPYVFGSIADLGSQGLAEVDYVQSLVSSGKLPAHPKIATVYYNVPSSAQTDQGVVAYAKRLGMQVVANLQIAPNVGATGPLMARIASSHAQAIISGLTEVDSLAGIKAMSSSGVNSSIPWVVWSFGGGPSDLQNYAKLGAGGYVVILNFDSSGDNPTSAQFISDAKADGYNPLQAGVDTGYAQGLLAENAFKRCGYPCDTSQFLKALESTNTNLGGFAFGPIQYTASNHGGITTVRFAQWDLKDNKLVFPEPAVKLQAPSAS
jgi:branched-chain amino acid transport system substrate-binding protein